MAIKNVIIENKVTDILSGKGSTNPANVGIYFCNFTKLNSETITFFLRETGELAGNKNMILNGLIMTSGDTFHFPYEKFILASGDTMSASGKFGNRVSATVSFLNI